ncbi:MAG TPA: DegV family protein [Firmicutes bacterium]|nr:DegV family protein [Bacillota bacterium]
MNKKIAILTDSTSSIDFLPHDYSNIFQVRLTVMFDQESYIDGETITVEQFYDRITKEDIIPKTSQPSVGDVVETIENLKQLGYTDVIYIPLSKALSGTYQAGYLAKELVNDIDVHIVDTKLTAAFLGYMVLEAANLVALGKTIEEIMTHCENLTQNSHFYFLIKDVKYLVKNGRLSNAAGFFGSLLQIVPIIEFNKEGEIVAVDKKRTMKKALAEIIDRLSGEIKGNQKIQFFVCHGMDLELLERTKEELGKHLDLNDIIFSPIPPVVGAHVGNSCIGLGYFILQQ